MPPVQVRSLESRPMPDVPTEHQFDAKGSGLAVSGRRDIEAVVLARAVRWHVERRVPVKGHRCVAFR